MHVLEYEPRLALGQWREMCNGNRTQLSARRIEGLSPSPVCGLRTADGGIRIRLPCLP